MVKCCVLWCENDSLKQQHVSYHQLPPEAWKQSAYICMDTESEEAMYACSEHYKANDFMEDQDGDMQLKRNAVPVIRLCRICLQTNIKMVELSNNNLSNIYEDIVGVAIKDFYFSNMLCIQCAHRLRNFHRFKEQCDLALSILVSLTEKKKQISKKLLAMLNRERSQLKSTLSVKKYGPNYCDISLDHDIISKIDEYEHIDENYEVEIDSDDIKIENELDTEIPISNNNDISKTESSDDEQTLKQIVTPKKIVRKKKTTRSVRKKTSAKCDRRFKPLLIDGVGGNLFTITKRSEQDQMLEIWKRKESPNFQNSRFPCMICFKGFMNEKSYSTHMLRHTDEFGLFPCSICKVHFRTLIIANKHRRNTHSYEYRCNQCSFVTACRSRAKLHLKWHKGKMYVCAHCKEIFKIFSTYMTHLRKKHPSNFVCELCGLTFVSVKGIELHKHLKHVPSEKVPEDGPFCETCDVRFISEDALNRHLKMSARHNNEPPQAPMYRRHRMKSNDIQDPNLSLQDFTCEQCGMQMTDSRAYRQHFKQMHPGKNRTLYPNIKAPCMCDKCGKIYPSYGLLKVHFLTHTNERGLKCPQCEKTFKVKQCLDMHLTAHTKQRFPCHICGKSFSYVSNRQRHMIIHTGLRPYKCEICSKRFNTSTEKKVHVNCVHFKMPWPKRKPRGRASGKQGQNMQSTQGMSETDI